MHICTPTVTCTVHLIGTGCYNISEKELQTLARKQFLQNLLGMPLKTCDHCLVGKAHRVSFHTYPPFRRLNVIDLIILMFILCKLELLVVHFIL